MTRLLLSFVAFAMLFGVSLGKAKAGLFPREEFRNEIRVEGVMATYRSLNPPTNDQYELSLKGMAIKLNGVMGEITRAILTLSANINPDGSFNHSQKGAFEIRGGATDTVFLKGSITEAYTTAFAANGYLELHATEDIEGKYAERYDNRVQFQIHLGRENLNGLGFAFERTVGSGVYGFDYMSESVVGSADIGRPVPEPASYAAFATTLIIGLAGIRRRKNGRGQSC